MIEIIDYHRIRRNGAFIRKIVYDIWQTVGVRICPDASFKLLPKKAVASIIYFLIQRQQCWIFVSDIIHYGGFELATKI